MKVQDILDKISYTRLIGNSNSVVNDVIQLDPSNTRDDIICWCSQKNIGILNDVKHGTIITPPFEMEPEPGCNYIIADNPRSAFKEMLEAFFVTPDPEFRIESSARIASTATVGKSYIGHNTVIEDHCVIGDGCIILHNNVIHANTKIQDKVRIGSNNTIGGVGFGYEKDEQGNYSVIPHIGNVTIEEAAEIGNNTCIDRAVLGTTLISRNAKIDNLVHIAHGVVIGENSLIIANAMVAGSVRVGRNSWVAPSSSILNKVTVGNDVTIGMGAVVLKNVTDGEVVVGNPAKPLQKRSS